ncbi:MAG TPA: hypothetical protein P5081_13285 [Phycisphaerae bacterium]|mgnify:CR=1 FL=1|nr:hypothetical protein [Phycisphaerae bacterium]HRW53849.1 hypothetical protein [Phycisphaerae bacterium]
MTEFLCLCLFMISLAPAPAGDDTNVADESHVLIKGELYHVYPIDLLEARGVPVRRIPNEDNAAYRYFDAINLMPPADPEIADAIRKATNGEWPEGDLAERLDAYIDQCGPSLDIVREAARMPDYFLPLFGNASDSVYELLLPSLGDQRQLARILVVDAHRQALRGAHDTALENLMTTQRMGAQLGHGSTLIEGLVGTAIGAMASEQLVQIAEKNDIDSDALRRTVDEMDALAADMPTFEEMLAVEEAISQSAVEDLITDPAKFAAVTNSSPVGSFAIEQAGSGWNELLAALRRVYLPDRAVKRHTREYYKRVRKGVRPTKDGTPGTILEEDRLFESVPSWDIINQMLMPSLSNAYEVSLRSRSNFERAKLRVAATAYQRDHGSPPPSLEALVPGYLPRVNADPMTGYDFDYRPQTAESGGFVGLETVTRDNAEELRRKRRTPAILSPRASKWRRYVMGFSERYDFSESQRNSAEAILRDIEARAAAFERTQGARIRQLLDAGDMQTARGRMKPLDRLFDEMTKRLERLPTAAQRAAVADSNLRED